MERLIANLVDNALLYNVDHGRVDVATETLAGHAVLSVVNTGPMVPPEESGDSLSPSADRAPIERAGRTDTD